MGVVKAMHVASDSVVEMVTIYKQVQLGNSIKWPIHSLALKAPFPDIDKSLWPTATSLRSQWEQGSGSKSQRGGDSGKS